MRSGFLEAGLLIRLWLGVMVLYRLQWAGRMQSRCCRDHFRWVLWQLRCGHAAAGLFLRLWLERLVFDRMQWPGGLFSRSHGNQVLRKLRHHDPDLFRGMWLGSLVSVQRSRRMHSRGLEVRMPGFGLLLQYE